MNLKYFATFLYFTFLATFDLGQDPRCVQYWVPQLSYRFLKAIGRSSDGEPSVRAQHQQGVRFEGLHEKSIH